MTHIISHVCMRSLLDNHRDLATNDGKPFQTEGRNILTSKQLRQKGCNLPASGLELSESSVRASTSTAFNASNKFWQQVGFGGGVLIQELHTEESCPLYVHEKITLLQNEYKYRVIGTASLIRCLVNILTTIL